MRWQKDVMNPLATKAKCNENDLEQNRSCGGENLDCTPPEGLMLFTFHIQNHINNMFQHLGTSNVPRLGYMAYQEDGDVMLLGDVQQCCRTFPHLKHHEEEELYKLRADHKTCHLGDNKFV